MLGHTHKQKARLPDKTIDGAKKYRKFETANFFKNKVNSVCDLAIRIIL